MRSARLSLVCLLLAAACFGGKPTSTPKPPGPPPEGTIRLAYPFEPQTLNPVSPLGASRATRDVLRPVWPALFRLDDSMQPSGELAESWRVSKEPFRVRITLRRAKWSDGKAISSTDVAFTLDKLRGGPTANRYRVLDGVRVVSPRVLQLEFNRPYRRWWSLFSVDDGILPAHAFGDGWDRAPTVGGGPFVVDGWTSGLSIRLKPNPNWWGGRPKAAALEVIFVPDEEDRLQLLAKGELDVIFGEGNPNQTERAKARTTHVSTGSGRAWWELHVRRRDPVTRAIALALDRSLATEMFEDDGRPLNGIAPRFTSTPKVPDAWPAYDLEAAKKLLRDAGYRLRGTRLIDGDGDVVTFRIAAPQIGGAQQLARFAHFRLRDLGLFVELMSLSPEAYEREWLAGDGEAADAYLILRRASDAPDADAYRSDASNFFNPSRADVADAEIDRAQAGSPSGPAVGLTTAAWLQAQQKLAAQGAVLPLASVGSVLAWRDGIQGPVATGGAPGPLWNAEVWGIG